MMAQDLLPPITVAAASSIRLPSTIPVLPKTSGLVLTFGRHVPTAGMEIMDPPQIALMLATVKNSASGKMLLVLTNKEHLGGNTANGSVTKLSPLVKESPRRSTLCSTGATRTDKKIGHSPPGVPVMEISVLRTQEA